MSFADPPVTMTLPVNNTTFQFIPVGPWRPAIGVVETKAILSVANSTDFKARMGYQTATCDTSVGIFSGIGLNTPAEWNTTEQSGDGRKVVEKNFTTTLDSYMWVRLGVLVASTTSTMAQATVTVQISGTD